MPIGKKSILRVAEGALGENAAPLSIETAATEVERETVAAIAERNKAEICEETLADELLIGAALTHSKEWNINGENVTISVEKV